ncbi:ribose-5-phosphate isomerase B [Williamsoniiplasma somnilux]|uniref:Ribose-5-phosphate isomerase B n=1 Tax=Williamsoniiplasma somnilux TaxID=215578 RepID=A0A2K8NZ40_9MOLU|nr:ribose 5-phosphate isomerase B [Williamsoniiplasma somnilux]ATZ19057.1 ribose-5-phosphate isomerase B [Williamsoniiplasma somnilux]
MKEKIYIANDHTAVEMKQVIINFLKEKGYKIIDLGTDEGNACSYSEKGIELGEAVAKDEGSLGIALCGTGIGISIAANKVKGIRAALIYEIQTAELARQHNNANILATGARLIANDKATKLVDAFLKTSFEGGRHEERIKKINEYTK